MVQYSLLIQVETREPEVEADMKRGVKKIKNMINFLKNLTQGEHEGEVGAEAALQGQGRETRALC